MLPDVSLRGAKRRGNLGEAVAARTSHRRPHALPNLTVAALTAQPLAALPPYGCGVPFTGVERLWQLHISARLRRPCNAPGLSLRGGRRPTWQSREGSYVFADGFPVIRHCPARFPRRFAPRNDKPESFSLSTFHFRFSTLSHSPEIRRIKKHAEKWSEATSINQKRNAPLLYGNF